MTYKVKVKHVRKPFETSQFEILSLEKGEERLIQLFTYRNNADVNDSIWGEETARREALAFAKKWEDYGGKNKEEIIYQTPDQ